MLALIKALAIGDGRRDQVLSVLGAGTLAQPEIQHTEQGQCCWLGWPIRYASTQQWTLLCLDPCV
jgi:hypothetical protein